MCVRIPSDIWSLKTLYWHSFDSTYFTVKVKQNPNNNAFTAGALDLHVDLPQVYNTPDVSTCQLPNITTNKVGDKMLPSFVKKCPQIHFDFLLILVYECYPMNKI